MSFHCLIIYGLLFSLQSHAEDMAPQVQPPSLQNPMDLRSWKSHSPKHHQNHLRNAHGILNIMGWGTLLPIGVIIARYFREFPMQCSKWYSLHIQCQVSGFILGTIGWGIGLRLGNGSKQYSDKAHRILSTIIFTFTTIQVLSTFLQPNKWHKYWVICHHLMGYALIALIVANVFEGIKNQSSADGWRWFYVGELGVLATIALALEIFRYIKSKNNQPMVFSNDSYT